ncbi:hypothetical protein R1sor_018355 [Riccia sorocarpa]|uniref:Hflx-type G domain-containing protein n=1 Tax=Riccia sorocarpa TaxID=122646 RepID=A0ABD3I9H1_9MARC
MTRMGLKSFWASRRSIVRLYLDPANKLADYPAVGAETCWQKKSFSSFTGDARVPLQELAPVRNGRVRYFSSSAYAGVVWRDDDRGPPRLMIVQPRIQPPTALKAKLLEALRLADSLEDPRHVEQGMKKHREPSPYVLVQNPPRVHAGSYFGPGTISTVHTHIHVASTKGKVDAVFVNAPLSGVQQRNLEDAWGKPVLDRVGLIIEIFGAHAQSKAAKLQVELASLNYYRSRLVRARGKGGARLGFGAGGEAEVVSARGRATGAIGGAGETEIQLQRRRISTRKHRLKSLLAEVDRTQTLHRLARSREGFQPGFGKRLPVVAVVGYTNAGKSSLVAALSRSDMYVDDKLFATLDTRSRRMVLPSGRKVILSDTVGFISDLPVQLVEAFQATLKEVVDADYLLHVIDSSAANANEQRETVLDVLRKIGVSRYKMENCLMEVWNKIDLSGEEIVIHPPEDLPKEVEGINAELFGIRADDTEVKEDGSVAQEVDIANTDEEGGNGGPQLLDLEWTADTEDLPSVRISVLTRTGLLELSRLLDRMIQTESVEEGSVLLEVEHQKLKGVEEEDI